MNYYGDTRSLDYTSHGSFSRCLNEQPSLPGATAGSGVQASDFVTV